MSVRVAAAGGLACLVALAAGCGGPGDFFVANPCEDALEIVTYSAATPRDAAELGRVTLDPLIATKLDRDLVAAGEERWSIEVVGTESVVEVIDDEVVHGTVAIPAEACEAGEQAAGADSR